MYRAQRLFDKQGFKVIPYRVDYKVAKNSKTTLMDFLTITGNLELTEIEIKELIGNIYI
jgi:uncharacterized SAM-binding protein YcdF (DUF218 family)